MIGRYAVAVLIGLDVLANALLGGAQYETISCRVGMSIRTGGWAARVPWPAWLKRHCLGAVYETIV
jgi:hypothetical protein